MPARQLQAEARLTRELQALFADVSQRTIQEVLRRNRLPTDDTTMRAIINQVMRAKDTFEELLGEEALQAARYGRNRIISELQKLGVSIGFSDFSERVQNTILEHVFVASDRTMQRIVGDVMGNLAKSYEEGLGIDEAAGELGKVFERMQDYELRRVARTEINSFQNEGAYLTEQELGIEYHMWYTALDERVRDEVDASHVEMHGQIVRVGEPFSNGLEYPGDRSGGELTIKEWINCRCRVVPFLVPEGMRPPTGASWFYESDLVTV